MHHQLSPITYPEKYFSAMIYWAITIAKLQQISLTEAMLEYTDLYGSLTDEPWENRFDSKLWQKYIKTIALYSNAEDLIQVTYDLYLKQDYSNYASKIILSNDMKVLDDRVTCGPLVLAYDEYNKERDSVRIYYNPTREETSWLASIRYAELEQAFKQLLNYAKQHYPATYFTSSTWLNNIPNFIKLFPDSFNKTLISMGGGSYLGLWGQFVTATGYGNTTRLAEFKSALAKANTYEEAIEAIPLKVLEGIGKLEDFYKKYDM